MRGWTSLLLFTSSFALAACFGTMESECHRLAIEQLGCCPMCDESCGADPATRQQIDLCVEAHGDHEAPRDPVRVGDAGDDDDDDENSDPVLPGDDFE